MEPLGFIDHGEVAKTHTGTTVLLYQRVCARRPRWYYIERLPIFGQPKSLGHPSGGRDLGCEAFRAKVGLPLYSLPYRSNSMS